MGSIWLITSPFSLFNQEEQPSALLMIVLFIDLASLIQRLRSMMIELQILLEFLFYNRGSDAVLSC